MTRTFWCRGDWNIDKGNPPTFGFKDVPGYNADCLSYGDFTDLPDVTESYFMSHTGDYDQDTIYMLSKSTDASYKFMEYVDGAWKNTTGTISFNGKKTVVTGRVLNPVECVEMLDYEGMCIFDDIRQLHDHAVDAQQVGERLVRCGTVNGKPCSEMDDVL